MPTKYNITDEQIKEFYRLRTEEKLSFTKIGQLFGVSPQTVQRRLHDLGYQPEDLIKTYQYDKFYFYDIDTSEKAYWLGFITADGYINEERNVFSFHLGWNDRNHLEKFKKAIKGNMPIKTMIHKITRKNIAVLDINGKEFIQGLILNDVRNNKSMNEKPSPKIPEKFYRDYIRGLWDGDGYISKRKIGFCSSYIMCKWVQDILIQKCKIPKNKISFDSNIYRINISKGKTDVMKWLYYFGSKDISLDRKYKSAKIYTLKYLKTH